MNKKKSCCFEYDCTLVELSQQNVSNAEIARRLGVTRDAVRQMLFYGRDIYLNEVDGELHYRDLGAWKHQPDKGVNRLTGKRAPKPKTRPAKPLRESKTA